MIKQEQNKTLLYVEMSWNKHLRKWMMGIGDLFLYDFFNCGTVIKAFQGKLKKNILTKWKITIEFLGVGDDNGA